MGLTITSKSNPLYSKLLKLRKHPEDNKFIIEGEDLVELARSNSKLLFTFTYTGSSFNADYVLSKELYRNLSSYSSLPKVMGVGKFEFVKSDSFNRGIYLDGVQDPGNLGTVERSCLAFNYLNIFLSPDCVNPLNFKSVQASKGALFYLNISYCKLSDLKEKGYKIYATSLDKNAKELVKVDRPNNNYILVFGSEGQGVKKENLKLADENIFIEIDRKIESLNVGVAASIIMYNWR